MYQTDQIHFHKISSTLILKTDWTIPVTVQVNAEERANNSRSGLTQTLNFRQLFTVLTWFAMFSSCYLSELLVGLKSIWWSIEAGDYRRVEQKNIMVPWSHNEEVSYVHERNVEENRFWFFVEVIKDRWKMDREKDATFSLDQEGFHLLYSLLTAHLHLTGVWIGDEQPCSPACHVKNEHEHCICTCYWELVTFSPPPRSHRQIYPRCIHRFSSITNCSSLASATFLWKSPPAP